MMKHPREQKPLTAMFTSLNMLVIMTLITCVLCDNTSEGDVSISDTDEDAKTAIDKNTRESVSAIAYYVESYTGNVYNPVLQNFSALEHWMQREGGRQLSSKHDDMSGADSHGTRNKRSLSSRRCVSGNQCSRSLCPWEERMDRETTRTPVYVKYAECRTHNCDFSFANLNRHVSNILNLHTTCDSVRTDIRVLEGGREKWLTDWPIACICTRRRTSAPDVALSRHSPVERPSITFAAGEMEASMQQTAENNRPLMDESLTRSHLSRHERRLVRQYQRQQRRRQHVESFDELMSRRQRERNNSDP